MAAGQLDVLFATVAATKPRAQGCASDGPSEEVGARATASATANVRSAAAAAGHVHVAGAGTELRTAAHEALARLDDAEDCWTSLLFVCSAARAPSRFLTPLPAVLDS